MPEAFQMKPYYEFRKFSDYYFEDSFVLSIKEFPNGLIFFLEAVLKQTHPEYSRPKFDEQYCYKSCSLLFSDIKNLVWIKKFSVVSFDSSGQGDFGNIDIFLYDENGNYFLSGDWGEVKFNATSSEIK